MLWLNDFYGATNRSSGWNPRYDYHQHESDNRLSIEMPGVSRADLKVNVSGRVLTVEAKRNLGRGDQKWKSQWVMSESVNVEAVEAHLNSGILDIKFPLLEKSKTREIEVQ